MAHLVNGYGREYLLLRFRRGVSVWVRETDIEIGLCRVFFITSIQM